MILFGYRTICNDFMFYQFMTSSICVSQYYFFFIFLLRICNRMPLFYVLCNSCIIFYIFTYFMSYVSYITCPNLLMEQATFSSSFHKSKKISKTVRNSFRHQLDLSLVVTWRTERRSGKSAERRLIMKAHVAQTITL